MPTSLVPNPQTLSLLEMLGLPLRCDPATASLSGDLVGDGGHRSAQLIRQPFPQQHVDVGLEEFATSDPNEIELE